MAFRVMLLGAPGVGKGTYAKLLSKELGLAILTVGDLVRGEINKKTTLGQEMAAFSNSGRLVPDDIILSLVKTQLTRHSEHQGIIFDGFPRNLNQAQALSQIYPLTKVVNLRMKDEYLIRKILGRRICTAPGCGKNFNVEHVKSAEDQVDMPPLLPAHGTKDVCDCGEQLSRRKDDTREVVLSRLKVFQRETFPLVEYYKQKGVLSTIEIKKGLADFPKILQLAKGQDQGQGKL